MRPSSAPVCGPPSPRASARELQVPRVLHTRRPSPTRADSSASSIASSPSRGAPASINTSFTSERAKEEDIHGAQDTDKDARRCGQTHESIDTPAQPPTNEHPLQSECSSDLEIAFSLIRDLWQGPLPYDESLEWKALHITSSQFAALRRRLEDLHPELLNYFEQEVRYDYHSVRATLILRLMATYIHEGLQTGVTFEIWTWLRSLSSQPPSLLHHLASDITTGTHGKFKLMGEDATSERSPDGQFYLQSSQTEDNRPFHFEGSSHPQFIAEVGYTQTASSLEELAQEYYEDSGGDIKTVLTIDIKDDKRPPTDRTATFSLYRGPKRINDDIAFRDSHGNPVQDVRLQLCLSDFVPDSVLQQLDRKGRQQVKRSMYEISAQRLCDILATAERQQAINDASSTQAPSKKRKRAQVQWVKSHEEEEEEEDDDDDEEEEEETHKRRKGKAKGDTPYVGVALRGRSQGRPGLTPDASCRRQTRSVSRKAMDAKLSRS